METSHVLLNLVSVFGADCVFLFSAGGAGQYSDRGGGDGGASTSTLQEEEAGDDQQPQRHRRDGEWRRRVLLEWLIEYC